MVSAKDFKGRARKLLYYKFLFDKGLGLTNYLKYLLVAMGLVFDNVYSIIYMAIGYALLSFFIGWYWNRHSLQQAEFDVSNKFNPFVENTNKKLKLLSKNKKFK